MDTAVVVVEGLIPPGATEGTRFDLRVFAHPMTSTTSLEGGRLYTTCLCLYMLEIYYRHLPIYQHH